MTGFLTIATLVFDSLALHLPPIQETDTLPHAVVFRCENKSDQPVTITRVHASCGCTRVTYQPKTIGAGRRDSIVVEYSTLRRDPGTLDELLHVYTQSTSKSESITATLHVLGTIVASPDARWSHLRAAMGPLRLRRKAVTFQPSDRVLRIACANTSPAPLRLRTALLPPGISLRTEPAVIPAEGEADIVIAIDRTKRPPALSNIILDGLPCDLSERKIEVKILKEK